MDVLNVMNAMHSCTESDAQPATNVTCSSPIGMFTCGGCGLKLSKSCDLHTHMVAHHSDGSYHYDNLIKVAFPKYDTHCMCTQTSKMDMRYLRMYSRSRTGKPPKQVDNVRMKRDVSDTYIRLAQKSDEHIAVDKEKDCTTGIAGNASCIPYQFRTTTKQCRLKFQDSYKTLDNLNSVNRGMHNNEYNENAPATNLGELDVKPNIVKPNDPDSDTDYSMVDDDSDVSDNLEMQGSPDLALNPATVTGPAVLRSDKLSVSTVDSTASSSLSAGVKVVVKVKRKRGRPRKIPQVLCDMTSNSVDSASTENISMIKTKGQRTQIFSTLLDMDDSDSDVSVAMKRVNKSSKKSKKNVIKVETAAVDEIVRTTSNNLHVDETNSNNSKRKPCKRKDKAYIKERNEMRYSQKFVCHICGEEIRLRMQEVHMNKHMDLRPYFCDACPKTFYSKEYLMVHKRYHDKERGIGKYRCQHCDAIFLSSKEYQCHMYTHNGEKPHKCTQCDATFVVDEYLRSHIRRVHEKVKKAKCDICDKMFYSKSALGNHYVRHVAPKLACKYCGRMFLTHAVRKHHELTHTGEKKFVCPVCKHGFIQWTPYLAHVMKQHGYRKEQVIALKEMAKGSNVTVSTATSLANGGTGSLAVSGLV